MDDDSDSYNDRATRAERSRRLRRSKVEEEEDDETPSPVSKSGVAVVLAVKLTIFMACGGAVFLLYKLYQVFQGLGNMGRNMH